MKFSLRIIISGFIFYLATQASLSFAQGDRSHMSVYAGSGLDYTIAIVLTDSQGQRAGLLSVPVDIGNVPEPVPGSIWEIPNSSVGYDAIDDHVSGGRQPGTLGIDINWPLEGKYLIEVTGTILSTYRLEISTLDKQVNSVDLTFKGVTDQGNKSTYQITYSSTPGISTTAVRAATFPSARQDIDLSFKIGWIKNEGLENSLIQKLQNAEADQGRGDTIAAKNTLSAFINEVKAQAGNGIDPDAATMLAQDAQYLIDHL